ncbi:unnamed protein product [Malus baccata var. baccata]
MVLLQCDMNMILLQLDSKNAFSSSLHVAAIFVWLQICFGTYTAVEVRTGDDDHKTKMRASFFGALPSCLRLMEVSTLCYKSSVGSPRKQGKKKSLDGSNDMNLDASPKSDEQETKKTKQEELMEICNGSRDESILKSRIETQEVDFGSRDGGAVDFILFKRAYGLEFLQAMCVGSRSKREKENALDQSEDVKDGGAAVNENDVKVKGKAARGCRRVKECRDIENALQFLKFCETFSEQTSTNCSWFQDLENLISASRVSMVDPVMKELPSECFSEGGDGYDALSFSQNLRLLNFLCDGALNAKTLRGSIEEQNKRVVQCKGFALAKNKERDLQAKSLEEMAKRATADNGSDGICEAVRIQPYLVDADGHCFWKPKGDFDLGTWDGTPSGEQPSVCSAKEPIDKYSSSPALKEKQAKRERRHSKNLQLSQTSSESNNENAQVSQTPDSNGKKGQVSQAPECNRENMELGPELFPSSDFALYESEGAAVLRNRHSCLRAERIEKSGPDILG